MIKGKESNASKKQAVIEKVRFLNLEVHLTSLFKFQNHLHYVSKEEQKGDNIHRLQCHRGMFQTTAENYQILTTSFRQIKHCLVVDEAKCVELERLQIYVVFTIITKD